MKMKKGFDVFTPTYNRAYCLGNVYKSLVNQEFRDFMWIIVDDGSTDETRELVSQWINEEKINIIYHYQINQGRFAAFNVAKKFFKHELIATVDSDDWLLSDGLEKIWRCWEALGERKKEFAGVLAHFETKARNLLGTEFPGGIEAEKIYTLYDKYGVKGDKFIVCRNDLIQKYNYPLYRGEKFGGDSLVYNWINDEHPSCLLRSCVAHREYMPDSITNSLLKHHLCSPNGMTDHYNELIRVEKYNKKNILKHAIGYLAYGLISGRGFLRILRESNRKNLTNMLLLPGLLYAVYLRRKKMKIECGTEELINFD